MRCVVSMLTTGGDDDDDDDDDLGCVCFRATINPCATQQTHKQSRGCATDIPYHKRTAARGDPASPL